MSTYTPKEIVKLELKANVARQLLIHTLLQAKSGHSAGPLGMADIFIALYFSVLRYDPKRPDWEDRDRLILSNGHICPMLYVAMSMAGYFPVEELMTLRRINSRLQGHPHREALPGLETTSGPLGEGLGQAVGIALTARMDEKAYYTYCLTSDGEHQEGSTWEAAMAAGKYKLHNLIQVIDFNNIQIDGPVDTIMPLEPFKAKYESFNWHVLEVVGNDIEAFIDTVAQAKQVLDKPILIIAHTIPGKGVRFMENDYTWHGKPPKEDEAAKAMDELEKEAELLHEKLATVGEAEQ